MTPYGVIHLGEDFVSGYGLSPIRQKCVFKMFGAIELTFTSTSRYLFLCEEWLALEKGDGRLERVLPLATREEVYQSWSMMRRRYTKHISEDHTFISVFMRQSEDHFTRAQRLGCAFSLLFMNMIANAMWYQTDQTTGTVTGLQIGPISFTLATVMTSIYAILTAWPVCFLVIFLFQKAGPKKEKKKKEPDTDSSEPGSQAMGADPDYYESEKKKTDEEQLVEDEKKPKKKNPRPLPHCVIHIAWFLVAMIMLASSFFSLLYSLEWGGERSAQWLGAFFLSFFEGEGLIDPVKVIQCGPVIARPALSKIQCSAVITRSIFFSKILNKHTPMEWCYIRDHVITATGCAHSLGP